MKPLTSNVRRSYTQAQDEPLKMPSGNWHKSLYGVAAAAMLLSNTAEAKEVSSADRYPLPKEIPVLKTTFPTHWSTNYVRVPLANGTSVTNKEVTKVVRPAELDLSQNFMIETPRYKIIRAKDWGVERLIGHPVSCITKVIFLDWNAGLGLDANRTRAAWSMVENNHSLDHITVRINHKAVWQDAKRLFSEPYLKERNNWFVRATDGLITLFAGETFASLRRGDYYNPETSTAVLYSNIEGISAHEFGHHQDFKRFNSDFMYGMSRYLPPVMLYQEMRANIRSQRYRTSSRPQTWAQQTRPLVSFLAEYWNTFPKRFHFENKDDSELAKVEGFSSYCQSISECAAHGFSQESDGAMRDHSGYLFRYAVDLNKDGFLASCYTRVPHPAKSNSNEMLVAVILKDGRCETSW